MANSTRWTKRELNPDEINGGYEFTNDSNLTVETVNGIVEGVLHMQDREGDYLTSSDVQQEYVNDTTNPLSQMPISSNALSSVLEDKVDRSELAQVATSGNYNDINNKPNLAVVATTGSYNDLNHPIIFTQSKTLSQKDSNGSKTVDINFNFDNPAVDLIFLGRLTFDNTKFAKLNASKKAETRLVWSTEHFDMDLPTQEGGYFICENEYAPLNIEAGDRLTCINGEWYVDKVSISGIDKSIQELDNFYNKTEINEMVDEINDDFSTIDGSITNINGRLNSQDTEISSAKSQAQTASTLASNAMANANQADETSQSALTTANQANTSAQSAVATANSALETAENALDTANSAKSQATSAENRAEASYSKATQNERALEYLGYNYGSSVFVLTTNMATSGTIQADDTKLDKFKKVFAIAPICRLQAVITTEVKYTDYKSYEWGDGYLFDFAEQYTEYVLKPNAVAHYYSFEKRNGGSYVCIITLTVNAQATEIAWQLNEIELDTKTDDKYVFRMGISGDDTSGNIDAETYVKYSSQFGLSDDNFADYMANCKVMIAFIGEQDDYDMLYLYYSGQIPYKPEEDTVWTFKGIRNKTIDGNVYSYDCTLNLYPRIPSDSTDTNYGTYEYSEVDITKGTFKANVSGNGAVVHTVNPNVYYEFNGSLQSLTISLGGTTGSKVNEYLGEFVSGATAPTVTFPATVKWIGGAPTIEANKTYQFSIINNVGVMVGV